MVNRQTLAIQKYRRSLRVLHGKTLFEVAQLLDRSVSYANCIEAGKIRPTSQEALIIARLLDTPAEALFPEMTELQETKA